MIKKWWYILFNPSNRLKIKNVNRSWLDRDERMFHACFTLLIDYVNKEKGGISEIQKEKNKIKTEYPDLYQKSKQYFVLNEIEDLYNWYNSINWKNPVPISKEYEEAINNIDYKTKKLDDESFILENNGEPADVVQLKFLRMEHTEKQNEFDDLCQKNLNRLVFIRLYLIS